jgi:hypothetical protein
MDEKGFFPAMVIAVIGIVAIVAILGIFGRDAVYSDGENLGGLARGGIRGKPTAPTSGPSIAQQADAPASTTIWTQTETNTSPSCTTTCAQGVFYCTGSRLMNCAISKIDGCAMDNFVSNCAYGCSDGACLAAQCTDTCTLGTTSCNGDVVQTCAFVNPGCYQWQAAQTCTYGCQVVTNSTASGAACNQGTPTCSDSDGGTAYTVAGTVSGIDSYGSSYSASDFCAGGYGLIEYSCQGGNPISSYYNCPGTGTAINGSSNAGTCSNDACV